MVGKTFKKTIAKTIATATTAAMFAGCFSGAGFAAQSSDKSIDLSFDHDTDVLSLVMDSADELVNNPYEHMVVSNIDPYLAVYASADSKSEIVGKLFPASYGEIVEKGEQWTKITSGDVTGYVSNEDVAFGDEAETLAKDIGAKVVRVTVDELNIRSGPNFISEIIASGKKDETYRIVPDGSELDEASGEVRKIKEDDLSETPAKSDAAPDKDTDDAKSEDTEITSTDEILKPIEDADGNIWYRVHLDGSYYGYVFGDCVTVEYQLEDAVSPEEEAEQEAAKNKSEDLAEQSQITDTTKASEQTNTSKNTTGSSDTTGATQGSTAQTNAPQTNAPQTNAPQTSAPQTNAPQTTAPSTETTAPPQTEPETQAPTASTDDAYLLASLVYCEAGAQSYEAQLGVANVVLNRVKSSYFPNTISEVIYESGQFGPAIDGSLERALANGPSSSCVQAANDALAGTNNIGNYLFFNNYAPSNASDVYTIGLHVFYTYSWL